MHKRSAAASRLDEIFQRLRINVRKCLRWRQKRAIDDHQFYTLFSKRSVRANLVRDDIGHALLEGKRLAIIELRDKFTDETMHDVAFAAPMISEIPC